MTSVVPAPFKCPLEAYVSSGVQDIIIRGVVGGVVVIKHNRVILEVTLLNRVNPVFKGVDDSVACCSGVVNKIEGIETFITTGGKLVNLMGHGDRSFQ